MGAWSGWADLQRKSMRGSTLLQLAQNSFLKALLHVFIAPNVLPPNLGDLYCHLAKRTRVHSCESQSKVGHCNLQELTCAKVVTDERVRTSDTAYDWLAHNVRKDKSLLHFPTRFEWDLAKISAVPRILHNKIVISLTICCIVNYRLTTLGLQQM